MKENKDLWLETGYEVFAVLGKEALKVETLAKKVGISKSSFYHHFVDIDVFVEYLLKHHLEKAKTMADKERKAQTIIPDFVHILVEHKIDLLFNRQLRVHQQNKAYQEVLKKSNELTGTFFVTLWAKDLGLNFTQKQLQGVFELALENFFLQINAENLNYEWLADYFQNLRKVVLNFS